MFFYSQVELCDVDFLLDFLSTTTPTLYDPPFSSVCNNELFPAYQKWIYRVQSSAAPCDEVVGSRYFAQLVGCGGGWDWGMLKIRVRLFLSMLCMAEWWQLTEMGCWNCLSHNNTYIHSVHKACILNTMFIYCLQDRVFVLIR